jgi:Ca-activated chloride channel family protein
MKDFSHRGKLHTSETCNLLEMKKPAAFAALIVAFVCAAGLRIYSQTPQAPSTIKVDVDLVLINATVTDREGRYVTGLGENQFEIYEDKIQQKIQYFSQEDAPVSVGIIFDVSGSMDQMIPVSHQAAVSFLKYGSPQDEYFLVEFNDRPHVTIDFTSDIVKLENHLVFVPSKGTTALYDALYVGLDKVKQGMNPKKALLAITDAGENHSRYSFEDLKDFAREKDVQLYVMHIGTQYGNDGGTLGGLARMTGGRSFNVSSQDLDDVSQKIAAELKNQYLIGYRPTNTSKDGKLRKVQVKVKTPAGLSTLSVLSKSGYYAGTAASNTPKP